MAFPTSVNSQITDATTQSLVAVTGVSSAVALAGLQQATAHALALAAHNATLAQQHANIVAQAAAVQGAALLYSLNAAASGTAARRILSA